MTTEPFKTIIVGLGGTGMSCARYFKTIGKPFGVVDSREHPPGLNELITLAPESIVSMGDFNEEVLCAAEELIVSPGIAVTTPEIIKARKSGVRISGDIDIFSKMVNKPIIAVTGSNGKSTVVALLAEILKEANVSFALGGNLDGDNFKPALDLLTETEKDIYVLELSSFQLETTESLGAEIATLLNISDDHMDRYDDTADYLRAKQRIFIDCKQALVNRDDSLSVFSFPSQTQQSGYGFSESHADGVGILEDELGQFLIYGNEKIIPISQLKVVGQHNISNVMAAAGLAFGVGVSVDFVRKAIANFGGLPHRCQWVASIGGVDFYNDSKGTNVGATIAAMEGLGKSIKGQVLLIAGGMAKGADFHPLAPIVKRWAKEAVLIGQDADKVAASLDPSTPVHFEKSIDDAVRAAFSHSEAGDAVLLSPACASFDMFENFQARGDAFVSAVRRLH